MDESHPPRLAVHLPIRDAVARINTPGMREVDRHWLSDQMAGPVSPTFPPQRRMWISTRIPLLPTLSAMLTRWRGEHVALCVEGPVAPRTLCVSSCLEGEGKLCECRCRGLHHGAHRFPSIKLELVLMREFFTYEGTVRRCYRVTVPGAAIPHQRGEGSIDRLAELMSVGAVEQFTLFPATVRAPLG